jgi:amino acid transporter
LSSTNTDEGFKKVIGVPALTLTILGGVIGAGIYALPAVVSVSLGALAFLPMLFVVLCWLPLCFAMPKQVAVFLKAAAPMLM